MTSNPTLSNALTARLRHAFTPQQIAEWSETVGQMSAQGLKIDDVFPRGIPVQDSLTIKTLIPMNSLDEVIAKMQRFQHIRKIEIFPRGIPVQESWRVHVGVGLK